METDSGQRIVLIVDDQRDIRDLFSEILAAAGFTTVTALNGQQALEIVRNRRIDLVICDLVMPEKEGLETIQELCQTHPALKVIAISGAFGGSFLKAAQLLGASAALLKPVSPDELVRTVNGVFG